MKRIRLRFAANCRKCGKTVPAGTLAYWRKGYGTTHIACRQEQTVSVSAIKRGLELPTVTLDYADARRFFLQAVDTDSSNGIVTNSRSKQTLESYIRNWKTATRNGSYGATLSDMRQWIESGYRVPGLDSVEALIPAKPRRKLRYRDEGDELLLDLAWNGSDQPWSQWEKRPDKPAISVNIHTICAFATSSKIVGQFQTWLARLLQTFEESGINTQVNLSYRLGGDPFDRQVNIAVKRYQDAADFASWSAMFSPGGYRMIGFTAIILGTDRISSGTSIGLGAPINNGWRVEFNSETNELEIGMPNYPRDGFPEAEMTEKLRKILHG